jgi:hypothetical protein
MASTIPATKYESRGALTFISAKEFLEAAGDSLHLEFGEYNRGNFPLNYREGDKPQAFHKAILFCIHHHQIQYHVKSDNEVNMHNSYKPFLEFVPLAGHAPEDIKSEELCILDLMDYCHKRMLERAILHAPDTTFLPPQHNTLSQVKVFAPYKFKTDTLPALLEEPGLLTIRLNNGWVMAPQDDKPAYYGMYIQFGAYKFKNHLPKPSAKRSRAVSFAPVAEVIDLTTEPNPTNA